MPDLVVTRPPVPVIAVAWRRAIFSPDLWEKVQQERARRQAGAPPSFFVATMSWPPPPPSMDSLEMLVDAAVPPGRAVLVGTMLDGPAAGQEVTALWAPTFMPRPIGWG